MDNSHRGLAFLLSLGTLPIACNPEKGDSDSDGATTGGPTTNNPSSSGTTTSGEVTESDGMTTGGTGSATGTSNPTTGPTTSAGETETGGPGGLCEKYVAHAMMCDPELDPVSELMYCETGLEMFGAVYGQMCGMLFEEYLACLTQAECNDEMACEAESMALYNCSPEIGPACTDYGDKYAECYMGDPANVAKYCQIAVNGGNFSYGPMCGMAYEEYYACTSKLSCMELMMGMACQTEAMAIDTACQ